MFRGDSAIANPSVAGILKTVPINRDKQSQRTIEKIFRVCSVTDKSRMESHDVYAVLPQIHLLGWQCKHPSLTAYGRR